MKRLLLVFGLIIGMLGIAGCGKTTEAAQEQNAAGITEEGAVDYAAQVLDAINSIVVNNLQEQYESDTVIKAALDSWSSALTEMGDFQSITGYQVEIGAEEVSITASIEGTERKASAVILLDGEGTLQSITTNVEYTFAEKMEKAALNTVLGMGTVFAVLILIILIISCFSLIARVESKPKKEETPAPAATAPIPAAEAEEDLADDCELVAVIAAAIAASEGAASTDGFVVRSIKRRSAKWQRA